MSARIPLTPDVGALFAVSFVGIVFTMFSRNVWAKRLVLPPTLLVFHVMAFLILQRSNALPQIAPVWIGLALLLNAAYVLRAIAYCPTCGRTVTGTLARRPAGPCSACAPG